MTTYYLWELYLRYYSAAQVLNVDAIFLAHRSDQTAALTEIRRRVETAPADRVLFSHEIFYPASDPYSQCAGTGPLCRDEALLRRLFLEQSRRIAEMPLESVWELRRPFR